MTPRTAFLQRVRQAVLEGNRAGQAAPLPERGQIGYQGAGPDPVQRFCAELSAAGGFPHVVPDPESACQKLLELVQASSARKILLGPNRVLDSHTLVERLRERSLEVTLMNEMEAAEDVSSPMTLEKCKEILFAADLGISGVKYLIAETGTVVLASRPDEPRSLSLLPPVHIALADRSQLVPDLFDLFSAGGDGKVPDLPSCLTLITGPSKTGDIELRLVTGVHGPGEIHVIICG